MKGTPWTDTEIAMLIGIKKRGATLKDNMHLLPGRSYGATVYKAHGLDMHSISATRRIQLLMQDGKERTAREIGELIGLDRKSVNEYMRVAVTPGASQWAHVARVEGLHRKSVYVYGPGENAERPESLEEMSDKQLDALHRSAGAWWPYGDPVLMSAMSAMVTAGRAAP
ncbi:MULTISPECIES: hypothetical protein [unclassified Caballeronia]|uniref:hypothetical protein n=1 Tax=unclassified Caballeronia TaxID=2646786 RepID=UPI002028D1CF|nr:MULTISPECIES: hypothetical protein [unclassified Caballeronia]